MKVLFLDIDGVLNSDAWYHFARTACRNYQRHKVYIGDPTDDHIKYLHGNIDDRACLNLFDILKETKCQVVLSSSWKSSQAFENQQLADVITIKGCPIKFLDITPITLHRHRGLEIASWLKENQDKYDIESFCILDDDGFDIHEELQNNFVHINGNFGLTYIDAAKAIDILNK